jgi:hypothetical protein
VRLSDCQRCGAGVGFKNATLCWRCRSRSREAALRAPCPSCGRVLRLSVDTGRCVRCSRTCIDCGHRLRFKSSIRCLACRRRHAAAAAKSPCARCGRDGFIRAETGWCGTCSRAPAPPLAARPCSVCGQLRRKKGDGMCNRCWTRSPARPLTQAENLAATLDDPPEWLDAFAGFAADRHCIARACVMVSAVGRLLTDGEGPHPQALLERARRPGRSPGALARTLEEFFVTEHLAFGLDQHALLARGRRQRLLAGVPAPLHRPVADFAEHLLRCRDRARRAGTLPRTDTTIEHSLRVVRDVANYLHHLAGKHDWATVDAGDIEGFLARQPSSRPRRMAPLRRYFRWARQTKLILVDPTRGLPTPTGGAGSSEKRSLWPNSAACSADGPATPACTPTKRSSASSPYSTPPRAPSCATYASTTSTATTTPRVSATVRTPSPSTRSAPP